MRSTVGVCARALAIRFSEDAAMGLPPRAVLIVAGLSRAARARSVGLQPRRAISWRRRPGWTVTLMTATPGQGWDRHRSASQSCISWPWDRWLHPKPRRRPLVLSLNSNVRLPVRTTHTVVDL